MMEIKTRGDLPKLMRHLNLPMVVVEVGTAEGIFSTEMYGWDLGKLYLVDIWENVPFIEGCASFEQDWHNSNYDRVKGLFADKPNVVLLKGFSYKMAGEIPDKSCGLIYIDGDHSYNGVKADIRSYWSKLVDGGIMAFHDFGNTSYGVNRALQEFTRNQGIHHLPEDGNYVNWGAYIIKGEFDYGI